MSIFDEMVQPMATPAARRKARDAFRYIEAYQTPGEVFYVDSGSGHAGNSGKTRGSALATIDQAINKCQANRGDLIVVLPGHAESIAAAGDIDLDVAGVTIQGLGRGTLKPTITLGTATTAEFQVAADNCAVRNLRLVSNINDLGNFFDIDAEHTELEDIDMVTSSAKEALAFINLVTTNDWLTLRRCQFIQPTDPQGSDGAAGTGALYIVDSENILVEDCLFNGFFETAIFHNKTTACLNLIIRNCIGRQLLSGAEVTQLVATATGLVVNSQFHIPNATDVTEANVWGTLGVGFGVDVNSGVLADGAAGGQLLAGGTAANS